jgi:predicted nucleic acid-binding protein
MERLPYVIDATSLINLEKYVPLWNFPPPGGSIIITRIVAEDEIKVGSFIYRDWLQSGKLEDLQGPEEGIFYELRKQEFITIDGRRQPVQIHDGEASAIAIAVHRHCILVTDDEGAKRKAKLHNVTPLSWQGFYKEWLG